jgi:hypothetical protein
MSHDTPHPRVRPYRRAAHRDTVSARRRRGGTLAQSRARLPDYGGTDGRLGSHLTRPSAPAVKGTTSSPSARRATRQPYTQTHDQVRLSTLFHSNVCLAQPFESYYRCPAGRQPRGADVTTTADSATITAQDRSQGRLEPVHAMNETTNPEGHKRSLPGRPPGIRADSSGLTDRQRCARSARPSACPAPHRSHTS